MLNPVRDGSRRRGHVTLAAVSRERRSADGCACAPWLAALEARILALEAQCPGPRDAADLALVLVIAQASNGLAFTTAGLWRRSEVDAVLSDALLAADLDSPRQLGKLLKRLSGHDVDGWRVARTGADRAGIVWRVVRVSQE